MLIGTWDAGAMRLSLGFLQLCNCKAKHSYSIRVVGCIDVWYRSCAYCQTEWQHVHAKIAAINAPHVVTTCVL